LDGEAISRVDKALAVSMGLNRRMEDAL
jgi:hypothetical protein